MTTILPLNIDIAADHLEKAIKNYVLHAKREKRPITAQYWENKLTVLNGERCLRRTVIKRKKEAEDAK